MAIQPSRAQETLESPGRNFFVVTPHDSTDFTVSCRAVWVGTGGDVAVVGIGQTAAVTIKNVPAGTLLPFRLDRVNSTNTTASDIVGIY